MYATTKKISRGWTSVSHGQVLVEPYKIGSRELDLVAQASLPSYFEG